MWTIIIIIVILFFIFYRAFKKQEIENIQIKNSIENDIDEGQKALKFQNYALALDIFKSIFSKNYTINNEVKASILLKMATCASKMKDTNECIAFLNEAERYNSDEADIYMLRAGELLQKDKLTEKDIEFIEKDINLYFKMNPYDRDIIQKMYNVLIIKAADVFNAKNNNYQVVEQIIGFNPSNVFKAQEDSFLLKQQNGQEYLLSGNIVQALNCFEYAYVLSNTSLGSILIMEKIIICHKYLEQYDEAVLLLDEIEDELEFSLFLYEMRAFSRLSSEKFNTVKDLAIVKEDIKSMKSRFSTIPNEKALKAYNTLRNILGKKLINHQDQSWRNDPQLVEIANDLIEK